MCSTPAARGGDAGIGDGAMRGQDRHLDAEPDDGAAADHRRQAFTCDGQPLPEAFHALAEFSVLASPIDPFDPMDKAFKDLGAKYLADTTHLHADWELVRENPLSEALLALSHVWRSPDGERYVIAAKGAPEAIADLCHLDASKLASLAAQVEQATAGGQRVLAVARAGFDAASALPVQQHDFDFEYLGFVGLHDPVRPGVSDAVAECRSAAIRTVMITGDYPGPRWPSRAKSAWTMPPAASPVPNSTRSRKPSWRSAFAR